MNEEEIAEYNEYLDQLEKEREFYGDFPYEECSEVEVDGELYG
jgi:hypothetical protein